jgi:hypothetical protein
MITQQATADHKYSKLDGITIFLLLVLPYFSYLSFGVLFLFFAFVCLIINKGAIMKRVI